MRSARPFGVGKRWQPPNLGDGGPIKAPGRETIFPRSESPQELGQQGLTASAPVFSRTGRCQVLAWGWLLTSGGSRFVRLPIDPDFFAFTRTLSMKRISMRAGLRGLATMAVAVGMMAAGMTSRAETVLSNLTATISSTEYFDDGHWRAQSFDTNAQSWVLNAVTISSDTTNTASGTGNFFADIYDSSGIGNSRIPGTLLGQLSGTGNPFPAAEYTYTSTGISLDPSSRYWVVMGVSSNAASYDLNYAVDVSATGV